PLPPASRIAFIRGPHVTLKIRRARGTACTMGRDESPQCADRQPHLPRSAARGRAADDLRGPDDLRCAEGNRRGGDFRGGVVHRLARRLPGAAAAGDYGPRAAHRSDSDKLLTAAAFISLVQLGLAPAWMVAIIIGRELAVTGLRSVAYSKGIV